ncbi:MAG: trypsin-like peptidase domain-containing protein [Planctomycetota bacterium]
MATYLIGLLGLTLAALPAPQTGATERVELVFFSLPGCAPCAEMKKTIARLEADGVRVYRVDASRQADAVQHYRVENVPTLVMLGDRQEYDRIVGAVDYASVKQRVDRISQRFHGSRNWQKSAPKDKAVQSLASQAASQPEKELSIPAGPKVRGQSPDLSNDPTAFGQLAGHRNIVSPSVDGGYPMDMGPANTAANPQQAAVRAQRATVRIRVQEGATMGYGTGTIIHVHGSDALVLTCGHLFRDNQANAVLSVDLFAGTKEQVRLPAEVIDFRADDHADIGLISFKLPTPVEPVPVSPINERQQVNQPVFSWGCDHGADPTRRDTRITHIDRYLGSSNIEIHGAPAVGRSGGGLFDQQGRLIGVCNAATQGEPEGIYASREVIYDQLQRVGLSQLYDSTTASPKLGQTASSVSSQPSNSLTLPAFDSSSQEASPPKQLVVVIRDASGKDRVVRVESPSAELLRQLEREGK